MASSNTYIKLIRRDCFLRLEHRDITTNDLKYTVFDVGMLNMGISKDPMETTVIRLSWTTADNMLHGIPYYDNPDLQVCEEDAAGVQTPVVIADIDTLIAQIKTWRAAC